MENIVAKLSNYGNRLDTLEEYQEKQNGHLQRLEDRVNKLIWAVVIGEGSIIGLLISLMVK